MRRRTKKTSQLSFVLGYFFISLTAHGAEKASLGHSAEDDSSHGKPTQAKHLRPLLKSQRIEPSDASPEESPERILGTLAGMRTDWEKSGFVFDAVLTVDFMKNLRGGIRRGSTTLGNLDLTLSVDTEKAGLWKNGNFFLYYLGDFTRGGGVPLSSIVGDLQGTDNIEAPETSKIYEAWYEHSFLSKHIKFLFGFHDYNGEFDALEYGGLFMDSSFGISVDISQVGPSIFPTTSLAGRLKIKPTENSYLLAAVFDGLPGDPHDPTGTHLLWKKTDGFFYALEGGITKGHPFDLGYFKYAAGAWYLTAEFTAFDGRMRDENQGLYMILERTLWRNRRGLSLGGFLQMGFARESRNQVGRYFGAGINILGLIHGRASDITGLAIAQARNGDKFLEQTENRKMNRAETIIEATYQISLPRGITIHPDIQYVINPSMEPSRENSLVAGVRLSFPF